MSPLCQRLLSGHSHHVHLASRIGQQHDDPFSQLTFKLVSQVTKSVHVHIVHTDSQQLHTLHIRHIIHDVAHGFPCRFCLQGLQFRGKGLDLCLHMLAFFHQAGRGCLQYSGSLLQDMLLIFIIGKDTVPRKGLDPADACRDTVLGEDLEGCNGSCICHMGSAAELSGEFAHIHHTDFLPVFLAEQSHGSGLSGILDIHHLCNHRQILRDLFIDNLLYLIQLFFRHGCEMAEVEAQSLPVHIGTGLFHMGTQHFPEGLVQQMGSTVVLTGIPALSGIHSESRHISDFYHAPDNGPDMVYLSAQKLHGILHLEAAVRSRNDTCVCILSSHGSIERCLLHNDGTRLSVCQSLHQLALRGQYGDPGLVLQPVITYELCGNSGIDGFVHRHIRSHVIGHLPGLPGHILLPLHADAESGLVDGKALLLQDLPGQIHGESVSIV